MADQFSPFKVDNRTDPVPGSVIAKIMMGTFTLDPASIAADTITTETATIPGLTTDMIVFTKARDATAAEPYAIVSVNVSAADTLRIKLGNMGAAANDPGSQTWDYIAFKPGVAT